MGYFMIIFSYLPIQKVLTIDLKPIILLTSTNMNQIRNNFLSDKSSFEIIKHHF